MAPIKVGKSCDISDLKSFTLKDKGLTSSGAIYKNLVEVAHEGITIADPEDNLIFVNEQFASSLGYKVNEITGRSLYSMATGATVRRMKQGTPLRRRGRKSRYEVVLIHKDGSEKCFLLSVSPLINGEKEYLGTIAVYADITRLKKTEKALKLSEKKFRSIIDQSYMGFLITKQGEMVFANQKLARMAGFSSPKQMKREDLLTFLDDDSRKKLINRMKMQMMGRPVPAVDEFTVINREGNKMHYQTFTKRIIVDGERMEQTFVLDVTDKKKTEKRLENRVRQIKALYRVYHHARIAQPFNKVLNGVAESVAQAVSVKNSAQVRIRFDGNVYSHPKRLKDFNSRIRVPLIIAGVEHGVLEVGYEKALLAVKDRPVLSQEKELVQNVAKILCKHIDTRSMVSRHKEIVNKAFNALIIVQGNKIKYANPRFYKMFRCKESEVIGKSISDFLPECSFNERRADGRVRECCARRKKGQDLEVATTMHYIDHHGRRAVLIRINDITPLKKAQAKLKNFNKQLRMLVREKTMHLEQANKRLQSLNELKDEFIAITSHELRSPLTSIRGYLSFLVEDEAMGQIGEPYREYLIRAYNTTDSLNYLINNILDVSRLDMGRFQLQLQEIDIVRLVKNVVDSLSFQTEEKKLTLEFANKTGQNTLPMRVDSIRMTQVLRNVLDNSIKFTRRGKKILVSISVHRNMLNILVSDQGVGIPLNKMEQIFDKFMQVKNTQTKYMGGVGLGLFIAKKIIQLHGGKIDAAKNEDKGTTISIKLPLNGKAGQKH